MEQEETPIPSGQRISCVVQFLTHAQADTHSHTHIQTNAHHYTTCEISISKVCATLREIYAYVCSEEDQF